MFEFNLQNLHHAYLIEGDRDENLSLLLNALKNINIQVENNPDFSILEFDSFKIDDAREIKQRENEKSFAEGKKVFIISAGGFLPEAQNALLKSLEEPKKDTHFFILTDRRDSLITTFLSRCLVIRNKNKENKYTKKAETFIKMNLRDRIDFIKDLLIEKKNEEDEKEESEQKEKSKIIRLEVIKFLDALEEVFSKKIPKNQSDLKIFEHLFKIREFLKEPGASPKMLMESIALVIS